MAEVGRMSMTYMEKKSILSNLMVDRYMSKVDFQVRTEPVSILTFHIGYMSDIDFQLSSKSRVGSGYF